MADQLAGTGLNVGEFEHRARGTVRYVSKPAEVVALIRDSQLKSTVILTQSGSVTFVGALLPHGPAGVLTIEGAPESHLGILSREFSIPAVMSLELTDSGGVDRLNAHGLVSEAYIQQVVSALDHKTVELDCQDSDAGKVFFVDGAE